MILLTVVDLRIKWGTTITSGLWLCFVFFVVDLIIKWWTRSRLEKSSTYLLSAEGLVDAIAVLPIPIALLIGVPAHIAWLLASLWLFKLAIRAQGLRVLGRVVVLEAEPLAGVFVVFLIVLIAASVAVYLLEGPGQPGHFGDLPSSLWWAVTTLTTTGYGDSIPQTLFGRIIAGLVMVCGLCIFGLLTGIIITGFTIERRRRDVIRNWDLVTRVPFLRDLDAPALIELTRLLRPIDLAERTVVVRQGRPADCMYFVASGEVEVKVKPRPIRLGPGSFFGEIALLEGGGRTATVATVTPSTLLTLEASDFRTFMAQHPEVARGIEEEAKRRIKAASQNS